MFQGQPTSKAASSLEIPQPGGWGCFKDSLHRKAASSLEIPQQGGWGCFKDSLLARLRALWKSPNREVGDSSSPTFAVSFEAESESIPTCRLGIQDDWRAYVGRT
jgi:hypothetical protein